LYSNHELCHHTDDVTQRSRPADLVTSNFVPVDRDTGYLLTDTYVVEVVVKPGLSKAQPIPFENCKFVAYAREEGSVCAMSGQARAHLTRKYM